MYTLVLDMKLNKKLNKLIKLKNMKAMILGVLLSVGSTLMAQNKLDTIQSSVECGMCKDRLEGVLNYTKGIKYSDVNYDDQYVVVSYNTKKITYEEICKVISETGYDADDVPAKQEAHDNLPKCCQKGAHH